MMQELCRSLRQEVNSTIVVVHAYADGPYDRSSFHIAGSTSSVVKVASTIAIQSIQYMSERKKKNIETCETLCLKQELGSRHPFVGMVDHVSVLPLMGGTNATTLHNMHCTFDASPHGIAAIEIGKYLEGNTDVKVLYYGDAHPDNLPLSEVRRQQTDFFNTSGDDERKSTFLMDSNILQNPGIVTVGAPAYFVENFNIRLTPKCNRKVARSLTRYLRERDGGLQGVEGLTLPYDGRYEMAGNLLRPDIVSSEVVLAKMDEWVDKTLKEMSLKSKSDLIEKAYRVGTTSEMCLSLLRQSTSEETMMKHDKEVMEQFQRFLSIQ
jgi:glutamate formiminotransferase